jgi:hypothetical protein
MIRTHTVKVYYTDETCFEIKEDCDTIALRDGQNISTHELVKNVNVILIDKNGLLTAHQFMDGHLIGGA